MEATIHITGKKAVKILGAVCAAAGVAALSAVIASGAAVGAVAEGFRSAKNTAQRILKGDSAQETGKRLAEEQKEGEERRKEGIEA